MDLPGKLGQIAKDAEKISERDTLRMMREIMHQVRDLLPGTDEDNAVRNDCRIHVAHIDETMRPDGAKPGSRRYNLVLLHSMLTLDKAARELGEKTSYSNARELCMLAYRRGRQFLPEELRPSTTKLNLPTATIRRTPRHTPVRRGRVFC